MGKTIVFIMALLMLVMISVVQAAPLVITSDPPGASVYINNALRGTTPATVDMPTKTKVSVKVILRDYKDMSKVVNGDEKVHFALAPLREDKSRTNSIRVESEPGMAKVYLNGVLKGTTPRVLSNLIVGKDYTIQVLKEGYKKYIITQMAGSNINAKLEPVRVMKEVSVSEEVRPRKFGVVRQAEPTTEAESFGAFSIASQPNGAEVYIDGVLIGQTPASTKVMSVRLHEVKVAMDGYYDYFARKDVDPDETEKIDVYLVKRPVRAESGDLYMTSSPTGAELYVDNAYKGKTPLTVKNLRAGEHKVKVSLTGYKDYFATKTTSINRVLSASATLLPLREAVKTGEFSAKATKDGAAVYVDGVLKGETPLRESLDVGTHKVTIIKEGFNDWSGIVNIVARRVTNIFAKLVLSENKVGAGNIQVKSRPLRAQVFVDGELKGITPLTLTGILVGQHSIKVSMDGYNDYTTTVDVGLGRTANVWASLRK